MCFAEYDVNSFSLFWSASELNSFGGGKVNREKTFHASIDTVCVFF